VFYWLRYVLRWTNSSQLFSKTCTCTYVALFSQKAHHKANEHVSRAHACRPLPYLNCCKWWAMLLLHKKWLDTGKQNHFCAYRNTGTSLSGSLQFACINLCCGYDLYDWLSVDFCILFLSVGYHSAALRQGWVSTKTDKVYWPHNLMLKKSSLSFVIHISDKVNTVLPWCSEQLGVQQLA
jgi:hypothetical protein